MYVKKIIRAGCHAALYEASVLEINKSKRWNRWSQEELEARILKPRISESKKFNIRFSPILKHEPFYLQPGKLNLHILDHALSPLFAVKANQL